MSELKPAYLICGDDEVKLDDSRARLRTRARDEDSPLEVLKDERLSAAAAAEAIGSLTLATGHRYVLADGVERWKDADVRKVAAALAELPADTIVVLIAKGKAPKGLEGAVESVGGEVRNYESPRPADYPTWLRERANDLGLELEREAARLLIERAPRDDKRRLRQQHLVRELEKLAIFVGPEGRIGTEAVEAVASTAIDPRVYELADAVAEGDRQRALRLAEELRTRGEEMMHVLFGLLRQLRQSYRAWALVAAGKSTKEVQSELRVPGFIANRLVAQARRTDGERLERALELLADLDYAIRGAGRLDSESALTLTLAWAAGGRSGG